MPDVVDTSLIALPKVRRYADKVIPAQWRDKFGRMYDGNADKENMHPTGPLTPSGWRAPHPLLFPPMKYMFFPERRLGTVDLLLDNWLADETAAWREWYNDRQFWAQKQYSSEAAQAIASGNPELLQLVGSTPMSLKFLNAMRAGNRWVLGLPQENGQPFPKGYRPPWATEAVMHSLTRIETSSDFTAVEQVDLGEFADETPDDVAARAQRTPTAGRVAVQYVPPAAKAPEELEDFPDIEEPGLEPSGTGTPAAPAPTPATPAAPAGLSIGGNTSGGETRAEKLARQKAEKERAEALAKLTEAGDD